jgi:hypothetical protein
MSVTPCQSCIVTSQRTLISVNKNSDVSNLQKQLPSFTGYKPLSLPKSLSQAIAINLYTYTYVPDSCSIITLFVQYVHNFLQAEYYIRSFLNPFMLRVPSIISLLLCRS